MGQGCGRGGPDILEPSDEELCARVAARDTRAFEALVERYQARAFRLAAAMLSNEADAGDVSQEAFIRLHAAAGSFDQRSKFETWFHRILVNLCIDHHRRNRRWRRLAPLASPADDSEAPGIDPPSTAAGPEDVAMIGQSLERLRGAQGKLSPKQRAAVLLQAQEGLSSREIAAMFNCSEATARDSCASRGARAA
jgi:RNA polymerase sigma-70 factor (ECF subfamily)